MGLDEIQDGKDYTRSGSGNLTCFDDRKWKYRKRVWKGKHQIIKNIRIKLIFKHEQWTLDPRWLTYKQKIKQNRILWNLIFVSSNIFAISAHRITPGFFIFAPKNPNNFSDTTPNMAWATSDGPWISINIKGDAKIHQFNLKWRNSIFNGSVYWNHKTWIQSIINSNKI